MLNIDLFNVSVISRFSRFPRIGGVGRIIKIIKENKIDIIHAQEHRSIGRAYLAAALSGKAFVYTHAGGPYTKHAQPGRGEIILFSRELFEEYIKGSPSSSENLHLVSARIDMDVFKPARITDEFVLKYNLPITGKKVVMLTRLHPSKNVQFEQVMTYAKFLNSGDEKIRFIIAGEGPIFEEIKKRVTEVNDGVKDGPIVRLLGPIYNVNEINQLYNYADIVIGSGRGLLEAMACSKPVIILGDGSEAEVLSSDNIEQVAYYNFSGRHFKFQKNPIGNLQQNVRNLINYKQLLQEMGEFSLKYVETAMNAKLGAVQIEQIYRKSLMRKPSIIDFCTWYLMEILNVALRIMRMGTYRSRDGKDEIL
ncbi:MAG: hypothetical protein A2161_09655 [Candidatus Schekmanbacteria bacterium RBG_13_48_7]|uniref:Glycosyl transferase family 1 domain-containing protein n=1 Tax=Candidatus Schekmanbacteria bacterium RBG_13_48_7 TaxID=1817878 RepID=A0A1F7RYT1_9BACT|nr:MAG: hypothetical protein A2161_09655 [Candidatus Schekmanbacteria bacterium RBG_13_48_7]